MQLVLAASDAPHAPVPVVIAKSPALAPVIVMPEMVSAALVLVLVSVAVIAALVTPSVTLPNEMPVSVAVGVDAVPVPERVAVCGEPVALSATLSIADSAPTRLGLNVA